MKQELLQWILKQEPDTSELRSTKTYAPYGDTSCCCSDEVDEDYYFDAQCAEAIERIQDFDHPFEYDVEEMVECIEMEIR